MTGITRAGCHSGPARVHRLRLRLPPSPASPALLSNSGFDACQRGLVRMRSTVGSCPAPRSGRTLLFMMAPACVKYEWLRRSVPRDARYHEQAALRGTHVWRTHVIARSYAFDTVFAALGCAFFLHANMSFSTTNTIVHLTNTLFGTIYSITHHCYNIYDVSQQFRSPVSLKRNAIHLSPLLRSLQAKYVIQPTYFLKVLRLFLPGS